MSAYKNLDINSFTKLVKTCSVISFRYNIIGGLNPNEQEDVYNKIANSISENKTINLTDFQSVYVSDINFENDFKTKQFKRTSKNHKIVKYLYSKIEKHSFNNDINSESDNYTIEHILPESADENWGDFNNEQVNRSIYRLGNLALLENRLNLEAETKPYSDKKEIFKKSNCHTTNSIPEEYNDWNENKVSARQRELAKLAKTIWRIQELN
ncbi:HNH endonuclease family protein [Algibacter pacificus]|uniref:HNH endonuclease family protein n=1 Tax=Algibacter pacificus TaxID=2599389 RepID=UPI001C9D4FD3|nr:HNH endonuclease family protein [Algibacter pacificus]